MSETRKALTDIAEILGRAGWVNDGHSVNIRGDVSNSQVAQTLTHSTNLIQQQTDGQKKALLEQLRRDVEELIEHLPAEKVDEAPRVAKNLNTLIDEATSDKPNRKWYSLSAEGLLEASRWTKDFTENIFGTIGQIGNMIWPGYSPPTK